MEKRINNIYAQLDRMEHIIIITNRMVRNADSLITMMKLQNEELKYRNEKTKESTQT